ncbi:DUF4397 domain-containing protein [Pontibacter sp. 172403-2]|uniref:DUF4397 domain-containing protein n=1 Tax=Pontibacter rufus TaxID=2791028 RepID=UPI0018B005C4|nr:DUF4397 domain-containing protein [Pontibacter sp. 172403-2]MBF9253433.1 DUF4397 domain-containing protein [Pontibacter sp. 172403-2]
MQNIFSRSSLNKITLLLFSVAAISFTSCQDDEFVAPDPIPTSYVSFYHGSPDAPDLDIRLENQVINNQAFKYAAFSGYLTLTPGERNIKFTPVNAANVFIDSTLTFDEEKAYSLFAINRQQNMELLVIQDSIKTPATGKAGLRIIHLSPDAPAIDISTTGTTGTTLATNLGFKGHTEFLELAAGKYSLQAKEAGTGNVLLTAADLQLEEGKTYSLLVRGFATPPTGNTNGLSAQLIRNY